MHINNLKIELDPRLDKEEEVYYLGRLKAPILIDMSEGATFLIFLSDSGTEELQIAVNNKENTTFSRYNIRGNKMKIRLDKRNDKDGKTFYVCKVRHPGKINCLSEACFLAFISKEGNEELQITGDISTEVENQSKREIEIITWGKGI